MKSFCLNLRESICIGIYLLLAVGVGLYLFFTGTLNSALGTLNSELFIGVSEP